MRLPRRDWPWAAAGLGMLLAAALLAGARQARRPAGVAEVIRAAVPERPSVTPPNGMIVAILEERDCGAFLEALSLFSDARQAGGVRVHALLLGDSPSPADVDRLRGGARLRFPVTVISPRRGYALLRSLGYRATPVVIVFDRDYRIRRVAPLEGPEPGRIVASLLRDLSISPELPPRS